MTRILSIVFTVLLLYCTALIAVKEVRADAPAPTCTLHEIQTDFGCFPNDPRGFTLKFYSIGTGFIAGMALLMLIYGGYNILSSRGDPRQINAGKSYIFYAIAGLLLAIFGYVFFDLVARGLLHLPGFSN